VKLYDVIMYHTLLEFVFGNLPFGELIKKDAEQFRKTIDPLYSISFLNEELKLKKFMDSFTKLQADVFFIQEYSSLLLNELKKS
jgi:hypothetical protein